MPPLYTWKCSKCEEQVEILRSIAEYESTPTADEVVGKECPHEWKKQIGKTSFKLLGGGWARDGYE